MSETARLRLVIVTPKDHKIDLDSFVRPSKIDYLGFGTSVCTMSDDFDWHSEDEAELVAASTTIVSGKRNAESNSTSASPSSKRIKTTDGLRGEDAPSTVLANKILKERFGLNGFRLEQEAAITRVLDGGSAVVVFPTGGGKSLCYQVSDRTYRTCTLLTRIGPCGRLPIPGRERRSPQIREQRC